MANETGDDVTPSNDRVLSEAGDGAAVLRQQAPVGDAKEEMAYGDGVIVPVAASLGGDATDDGVAGVQSARGVGGTARNRECVDARDLLVACGCTGAGPGRSGGGCRRTAPRVKKDLRA
ncbi:hypothetical protein L914_09011 [Phytophthora nicotianae]|uniref:Uncharacterized protein n=1 Tax=Phytophthora nicotianae TaxID=4792 RepID=W2NBR2_PHYNI|nr:hypothetical protein L914_09011 [Phytophthora nicotianae]